MRTIHVILLACALAAVALPSARADYEDQALPIENAQSTVCNTQASSILSAAPPGCATGKLEGTILGCDYVAGQCAVRLTISVTLTGAGACGTASNSEVDRAQGCQETAITPLSKTVEKTYVVTDAGARYTTTGTVCVTYLGIQETQVCDLAWDPVLVFPPKPPEACSEEGYALAASPRLVLLQAQHFRFTVNLPPIVETQSTQANTMEDAAFYVRHDSPC